MAHTCRLKRQPDNCHTTLQLANLISEEEEEVVVVPMKKKKKFLPSFFDRSSDLFLKMYCNKVTTCLLENDQN
jgi:hypothetical protein